MKIKLNKPKEIVIVPEKKITISEIEILEIVDNKSKRMTYAITNKIGIIDLWKDAEYTANSNWTDDDVIQKIKEIYS